MTQTKTSPASLALDEALMLTARTRARAKFELQVHYKARSSFQAATNILRAAAGQGSRRG